jgi:S1-C subfamily serine protease
VVGLDWVLLALLVVFALIGYAQGFLTSVLSLVGFVGGAVLALIFVPRLLAPMQPGLGSALLALLLVLLAAALGQWLMGSVGERLRDRIGSPPVRRVDGVAGALVGMTGFVLVAWFIGAAVSSSSIPVVSTQARNSTLLRAVEENLPVSADGLREDFRTVMASAGFPEVVAPFVAEVVPDTEEVDGRVAKLPEVRQAARATVRVSGESTRCSSTVTGSGVLVSPGRVLTNAHVVAGTRTVTVSGPNLDPRGARVIYFDPRIDVAVLDVRESSVSPVERSDTVTAGERAVIAGYPEGGRLRREAARVRGLLQLEGLDIYGNGRVLRDVVSLRGSVRPGSSGGPVLNTAGEMVGLVFAASLTHQETAYAIAPPDLEGALAVAADPDVRRVPTGPCLT